MPKVFFIYRVDFIKPIFCFWQTTFIQITMFRYFSCFFLEMRWISSNFLFFSSFALFIFIYGYLLKIIDSIKTLDILRSYGTFNYRVWFHFYHFLFLREQSRNDNIKTESILKKIKVATNIWYLKELSRRDNIWVEIFEKETSFRRNEILL